MQNNLRIPDVSTCFHPFDFSLEASFSKILKGLQSTPAGALTFIERWFAVESSLLDILKGAGGTKVLFPSLLVFTHELRNHLRSFSSIRTFTVSVFPDSSFTIRSDTFFIKCIGSTGVVLLHCISYTIFRHSFADLVLYMGIGCTSWSDSTTG